jgi:hypothetical protein
MVMKRVDFAPRLISKHLYSEGPRYRFTLEADLLVYVHRDLGYHTFADGAGNVWLSVDEEVIIIRKGYSTDGCSPKARVMGFWLGTPDFAWTRLASTVHDAFYQWAHCPCCPLTRLEADWLFYELMLMDIDRLKVRNPGWARLIAGGYRNAVMSAGVPFYHWGSLTKKRDGFCKAHGEEGWAHTEIRPPIVTGKEWAHAEIRPPVVTGKGWGEIRPPGRLA